MTLTMPTEMVGRPLIVDGHQMDSALSTARTMSSPVAESGPNALLTDLRKLLQAALEVEHMTIPPYLTAMYTIKPGANQVAYEVIRSVVVEEMLHMTLAANILIAVGGTPRTTYDDFMRYPTCIPCRVPSLWLPLRHFSQDAITTFMTIESPAGLADSQAYEACEGQHSGETWSSIGEFYKIICQHLEMLVRIAGEGFVFGSDPAVRESRLAKQVGPDEYYNSGGRLMKVIDFATAMQAMDLIVEQGEGFSGECGERTSKQHDADVPHYYRFKEIQSEQLYRRGEPFTGKPSGKRLKIDWEAVYRIEVPEHLPCGGRTDRAAAVEPESALTDAIKHFNKDYAKLLALMELAFDGRHGAMRRAVQVMFDLKYAAQRIVRVPLPGKPGYYAHPTFEVDQQTFNGCREWLKNNIGEPGRPAAVTTEADVCAPRRESTTMTTTRHSADAPVSQDGAFNALRQSLAEDIAAGDISYIAQPSLNGQSSAHGESTEGIFSVPPEGQGLPNTGKYLRMFDYLPAYVPTAHALMALGQCGGPMDANPPKDGQSEAPPIPDSDRLADFPVGLTYFGQFLDHNITFQASSNFELGQSAQDTVNTRSGRVGLEHLYGFGPDLQSALFYDRHQNGKFWIDCEADWDVPRNKSAVPLIPDPRNDTNVIIAQLHLIFMKFHNAIVDALPPEVPDDRKFGMAQETAAWHFQWLVLNEFLPKIVTGDVYERVVKHHNPTYYKPELNRALVPVEFATAGYRLHSLVTECYQLNDHKKGHLFKFRKPFTKIEEDCIIDWKYFFDLSHERPAPRAKRFDGKIVHTFLDMPGPIDSPLEWPKNLRERPEGTEQDPRTQSIVAPLHSIAVRNMLRGRALGLPSGQAVARHLGLEKVYSQEELGLGPEDLAKIGVTPSELPEAPLWYYVMKEADLETGGTTLGTVGSTIVAEVLYGLIAADPSSYLYRDPRWKPCLHHKQTPFGMADLIEIAEHGVRKVATVK